MLDICGGANVLSRQRCGLEFDRAFLQDMFQELKIYDTDIDTHVYGAEDGSLYRNASELEETLERGIRRMLYRHGYFCDPTTTALCSVSMIIQSMCTDTWLNKTSSHLNDLQTFIDSCSRLNDHRALGSASNDATDAQELAS